MKYTKQTVSDILEIIRINCGQDLTPKQISCALKDVALLASIGVTDQVAVECASDLIYMECGV